MPVMWALDPRALVRHIRRLGALRGIVSTDGTAAEQLVKEAGGLPTMAGLELASRVSCEKAYRWEKGSILTAPQWNETSETGSDKGGEKGADRFRVVAYDFGTQQNILSLLWDSDCDVQIFPARTSSAVVLAMKPDGVFLSNGPGCPEPLQYCARNIP